MTDEEIKEYWRTAYCNEKYKKEELEKENAELKERVKILTIDNANAVLIGLKMKVLKDSHRDRANKTQEQLTKAKELLKTFLLIADNKVSQMEFLLCVADAEEFIKEI